MDRNSWLYPASRCERHFLISVFLGAFVNEKSMSNSIRIGNEDDPRCQKACNQFCCSSVQPLGLAAGIQPVPPLNRVSFNEKCICKLSILTLLTIGLGFSWDILQMVSRVPSDL